MQKRHHTLYDAFFVDVALILGDMDLLYQKILAREYGLFKAATVGAVALVLDNVEKLIAFVTFGHAGDDIYHKLRVLEPCVLNDDGVDILHILGDDQRELADIQHYLGNLLDVVFLGKIGDGLDH